LKKLIFASTLAAGLMLAALLTPASATASAGSVTKRSLTGSSSNPKHIVHLHHRPSKGRLRAGAHPRTRTHGWTSPTWFADPTQGDEIAGEDPWIRQAAVSALGNLNGSVVVVDPNTGRVLSIVNQKLAMTGAFTPCSTIKPVVAAGALQEGIITPESTLRAEGRFAYTYGTTRVNLAQAMAASSNEFFAKLGQMMGYQRFSQYAHEFGLGERAGLDIPGEAPGVFPDAPPEQGGMGMLTSFGSGIEMTPLQLAAIASAIANGGTLYYLQYPRTPEDLADFEPRVRRHLDGLTNGLPGVRAGMAASVLYGTSKLAYNPAVQIFGKTGTCSDGGTHLRWFGSFAGDQNKAYVIVVLLRGEGSMFGLHAPEVAGKLYRGLLMNPGTEAQTLLPAAVLSK
jgi:cell division protein FtsI/penicillin-binding protein 2